MNDRFKFRVYFKGSEYAEAGYQDLTREDVIYSLRADGQIIRTVVYECQREKGEESSCYIPFTPNNDLYDIQFSTGLKDKNGKLIYEGDIVKINGWWNACGPAGYDNNLCVVEFDASVCGFTPMCNYDCDCGVYHDADDCEVIGNIYENKELLQ